MATKITNDNIVGMDGGKLTGSVDAAKLTGTLPGGMAPATDLSQLETNQALLAFKLAAQNSLSKFQMVDQVIDEYQDATGIDNANSVNHQALGTGVGKYFAGGTANTVTVSGNYDSTGVDGSDTWYKWTTVRSDGTYTTDIPQDYEYLVIGGGGSGNDSVYGAGGGGAGGYRTGTGFSVGATTISGIAVGSGGSSSGGSGGYSSFSSDGYPSSFSTISASGGGGGVGAAAPGNSGGSGGGGGGGNTTAGGSGNSGNYTPAEGTDGGQANGASGNTYGTGTSENYQGGGGGGASQSGRPGTPYAGSNVETGMGSGGAGASSSIDGVATIRAGGGGGGTYNTNNGCDFGGIGGAGGGGAGGKSSSTAGTAGTPNTGSGGGGSRGSAAPVGGSGIVIIRRPTIDYSGIDDITLQSTATTAEAVPTTADLVVLIEDNAGSATVNTDIKGYISRDGSAFSSAVTFVDEGDWGTNKRILVARNVDISGIASGTSMKYKLTTHNQVASSKETRIHATSLAWS